MARPRKKHFSEGKANIIAQIIEEYDVKSTKDIHDALKELLGGTIQNILEGELDNHLAESTAEDPEYLNSRNGYKDKSLISSYGEIPINNPQPRRSDFEPVVVPKHKRDISDIENKIISMYARGDEHPAGIRPDK